MLSYAEGGITRQDLEDMFESIQKEKLDKMKFEARIHGCYSDSDQKNKEQGKIASDITRAHVDNSNVYEYGDAERGAFDGWTEEQKRIATENQLAMMMKLNI